MFKPVSLAADAVRKASEKALPEHVVNNIFKVMHGFYGNLFLSKFATGDTDATGQDNGILSARAIWAHGLGRFDGETVKSALAHCITRHPDFPPSLPQFVLLCAANAPRPALKPEPALGMSGELRGQYAAKAKALVVQYAPQPPASGLELLQRAIADAVGAAGGDEAATLLRLARDFAPSGAAA